MANTMAKNASNMMDDANRDEERVVLRLNPCIPSDKALIDLYRSIPRARRQEVMRNALHAGLRLKSVENDLPRSKK